MTSFADTPAPRPNPLTRAEAWLDERGRFAWIAAMVVGFIAVWPLGLAILGYMLWTNKFRMEGRGGCSWRREARSMGGVFRQSSGNAAFDAYRAETLRRLEEEQAAFEAFLGRLREARDKAEFDQFMDERGASTPATPSDATRESDAA